MDAPTSNKSKQGNKSGIMQGILTKFENWSKYCIKTMCKYLKTVSQEKLNIEH